MHCANDGEEGAGVHQAEPGAQNQSRRRQHSGSASPGKFQVNEQEAELELEVGPEDDHGQAEKWKANVAAVGREGEGGYRRLCWADNERIQDFQGGQHTAKNKIKGMELLKDSRS